MKVQLKHKILRHTFKLLLILSSSNENVWVISTRTVVERLNIPGLFSLVYTTALIRDHLVHLSTYNVVCPGCTWETSCFAERIRYAKMLRRTLAQNKDESPRVFITFAIKDGSHDQDARPQRQRKSIYVSVKYT